MSGGNRTKDRLRLFDLSLDLFCIAGFDGYFKDISPAWTETLGYTVDELCSLPFIEFVHDDDKQATIEEAVKLQSNHLAVNFENRYRRKEGGHRVLHWNARGDHQRKLIYAVARDVTELRETQIKLEESLVSLARSEKMAALGTMSAGIAHEINNPLLVAMGYTEQLREILTGGERAQVDDARLLRYVDSIGKSCRRMEHIVSQMLDYARSEIAPRASVDLNGAVERNLELLSRSLAERKIEVIRNLDVGPVQATGNERRIDQLILILLVNARDSIHESRTDGFIEVSTRAASDSARVSIRDNGCGIDSELLARIYEPFFTTKAPGQGTGLGLAIAHEIVCEHQGAITAESKPGQGTTMQVTLPAA